MTTPYNANTQPSRDAHNRDAQTYSDQTYSAPNTFNQDGLPVRPAGHTAMVQVQQKSKTTAFVLCLLLGGFGGNNFYMGQVGRGIGKLACTLILIFSGLSLVGLMVAGFMFTILLIRNVLGMILILTGTAGYGHDSHGVPLR